MRVPTETLKLGVEPQLKVANYLKTDIVQCGVRKIEDENTVLFVKLSRRKNRPRGSTRGTTCLGLGGYG